ncbi:hypothetical protein J2T20_004902 [Paenibacillus wynnii]|nr:hypothetical protein [Paenibacillus wynnii]
MEFQKVHSITMVYQISTLTYASYEVLELLKPLPELYKKIGVCRRCHKK